MWPVVRSTMALAVVPFVMDSVFEHNVFLAWSYYLSSHYFIAKRKAGYVVESTKSTRSNLSNDNVLAQLKMYVFTWSTRKTVISETAVGM